VYGKLRGAVHFPCGNVLVHVYPGFIQLQHFSADVDVHVLCVVHSEGIDAALSGEQIFPECTAVIAQATDSADSGDEDPIHSCDLSPW